MVNKKTAFSFVLFFVSQFAFSNRYKPQPGYYLNIKGDTVHCLIDFGSSSVNPQTIMVQTDGAQKEFGPADIKGFGISGNSDYVSATVTFHTNPISGEDLPKNFSDNTETKTCFLKVLNRNVYSLYSLALSSRKYFFVSYPDKSYDELVYRVKRSNDSLAEDQSYRNQILALFAKEGISQNYFEQISEVAYSGSAIGSLIEILNEKNTGVKTRKKSNLQIDVYAGILQNSFPTTFSSHYVAENQFASQISPTFGANFLYPLSGQHFTIGLSLGYNSYNRTINNTGSYQTILTYDSSTSVYNETLSIKNSLLVSNLYLMYMFNPSANAKFYLKAGINYNFSFAYNKNEVKMVWRRIQSGVMNGNDPYTDHYGDSTTLISTKNYFISFKCAAGVNFGRSSLELSYSPPVQLATTSDDFELLGNQTNFKYSTLGICYYFMLFH